MSTGLLDHVVDLADFWKQTEKIKMLTFHIPDKITNWSETCMQVFCCEVRRSDWHGNECVSGMTCLVNIIIQPAFNYLTLIKAKL